MSKKKKQRAKDATEAKVDKSVEAEAKAEGTDESAEAKAEGSDESAEGSDEETEGTDESAEAKAEGSDESAEGSDEETEDSDERAEAKAEDSDESVEGSDEETEGTDERAEAKAEDSDESVEAEDSDESAEAEDSDEEADGDAEGSNGRDSDERAAAKAEDAGDGDRGDDDRGDGGAGGGAGGESDEESGELYGLLAEFETPGELIAAAEKVRDAGYTQWDCYSPFPVHGIDPAMGIKRTILPWIVLIVGLSGLGGGLLLQWYTNAFDWAWIVSGKPFFSLPANIPITFETTILAAVFASFFGMWGLNKLPQLWHPFFKKDRFRKVSDDGFFLGIEAADEVFQRGKTQALLEQASAVAVETCYVSTDPKRWSVPRPLMGFIIVSCVASLVPFALVAKARASKSEDPRWHIFPDMDFQPKAKAQTASQIFADSRSSRVPPSGTVSRGNLKADDHFYRGLIDGAWADSFPEEVEVSMATIEHGRQQFSIYCQPCHGASGDGNGMIHKRTTQLGRNVRGWVQPSNLHQGSIVRQPHGQIFNTISHGIRTMPSYAGQIPEADRWAIVLYVRALQRSQSASVDDVPAEARQQIRE